MVGIEETGVSWKFRELLFDLLNPRTTILAAAICPSVTNAKRGTAIVEDGLQSLSVHDCSCDPILLEGVVGRFCFVILVRRDFLVENVTAMMFNRITAMPAITKSFKD